MDITIQIGNRYSVPSLNNIAVEAESIFKETGQVLVRNVVTSERQVVFISNLRPESIRINDDDPFESPMPELPVEQAERAIDRIVDALATLHTSVNDAEVQTAKEEIKRLSVAQLQSLLDTDIELNEQERVQRGVSSQVFFYARVAAQERRNFLQGFQEAKNIMRRLKSEYGVDIVDKMRRVIQDAGETVDSARLNRRRKSFLKALAIYCGDPHRVRETMDHIGIAVDFVTRNDFDPLETMWILRTISQSNVWSGIKYDMYRRLRSISEREAPPLVQQYEKSTLTVSVGGWHESTVATFVVTNVDQLRPVALFSNLLPKDYRYLLSMRIPEKMRINAVKGQYPKFMNKDVYRGMKYVEPKRSKNKYVTPQSYAEKRFVQERNSRYVLVHTENVEVVWFERLEIQSDTNADAMINLLPLHARGMTKVDRSGNYISLETSVPVHTLYTKTGIEMGTVLMSTATADDSRFLVTVAVYHEPKRGDTPERWSLVGIYVYRTADQMDAEGSLRRRRLGACMLCGQDAPPMECSHCDEAVYCNQQCADAHWEEHVRE